MKPPTTPSTGGSRKNGSETERSIHSIHGAMGGRPRKPVDMVKVQELLDDGWSIRATAFELGVGDGTLRRALRVVQVQRQGEVPATPRQKPSGGTL